MKYFALFENMQEVNFSEYDISLPYVLKNTHTHTHTHFELVMLIGRKLKDSEILCQIYAANNSSGIVLRKWVFSVSQVRTHTYVHMSDFLL